MKTIKTAKDKRVKKRIFPITTFICLFLGVALFTTLQMKAIGEYIDVQNLPLVNQLFVVGMWFVLAGVFTFWTNYQIKYYYQKPIEKFSVAASKVAQGDFSVYLAPLHTTNNYTYLDVLFSDFNKMVEELGGIETLKTDFFSNVSHEIKTPLSVIQNNAELLQKPGISEEQRVECTDTILHATKKLSNLITNMLKMNKLDKQVIKPNPQPYDVCAQLCECALQFEDMWEKKEIEFTADIEDRAMIQSDSGLLELVWTNLLSNALKFTPEGGTITLLQTSDAETITVSITDTGCGMDDETIRHIYEKFFQGDTSHSTEGNGLGLALVYRILQLSDGTISVKSELGKGSEFTVKLPISLHREELPNE